MTSIGANDFSGLAMSAGLSTKKAEASDIDGQIASTQSKLDSVGSSGSKGESKEVSGTSGQSVKVESGKSDTGEKTRLEEQLSKLMANRESIRGEIKSMEANSPDKKGDDKKVAGRAQNGQVAQNNTRDKSDGNQVKSDGSVTKSDSTATAQPAKKLEKTT